MQCNPMARGILQVSSRPQPPRRGRGVWEGGGGGAEEVTWHSIPELIVSILNVNKWGGGGESSVLQIFQAPLAPKLPVLTGC